MAAYQQMSLDEESWQCVTIKTHPGLNHYTWLPFVIALVPTVFQKVLDTILQELEHVSCYLDDI